MEEPQSLRSLFDSAKEQKNSLGSRGDTNTETYRDEVNAAISRFQECQRQVSILSLFSSNELLEDVSTGDLQYEFLMPLHFAVYSSDLAVQVHVAGIPPCRAHAARRHLGS